MRKIIRNILFCITGLFMLYGILLCYPQLLFGKVVDYRSFRIYSHAEPDSALYRVLDSATRLLGSSELFAPGDQKQAIFLCSGFKEYGYWCFLSRQAFAVNQFPGNHIFIARPVIATNLAYRNTNQFNTRSLSGLIAHETMHTCLEKAFPHQSLTNWQKEGYCDYIAGAGSVPDSIGRLLLCGNLANPPPAFAYFKYRLYIRYLMEEKGLTFEQIIKDNRSPNQLDEKIKTMYCR